MVNSFGQFTGDVRVSGHISQAWGGECVLAQWVGCVVFLAGGGGERGLRVKMLFGSRAVSLRPGSLLPYTPPSPLSQWTKQMEPGHGNDKKMH